jgi:origin recognition complex subunit 1
VPKFAAALVSFLFIGPSIKSFNGTLGMVRINFAPYTKAQLAEIVNSRIKRSQEGASNIRTVMKPDAILYAAARVGGVSGDARRALDICRYGC